MIPSVLKSFWLLEAVNSDILWLLKSFFPPLELLKENSSQLIFQEHLSWKLLADVYCSPSHSCEVAKVCYPHFITKAAEIESSTLPKVTHRVRGALRGRTLCSWQPRLPRLCLNCLKNKTLRNSDEKIETLQCFVNGDLVTAYINVIHWLSAKSHSFTGSSA